MGRNVRSAAFVMAALVASGVGPALAETVGDPFGMVEAGINGGDGTGTVAGVSHGGCARGTIALAIGDSTHACPSGGAQWWREAPGQDSIGNIAIGVLGANTNANGIGISDTGESTGCTEFLLDGCWASVALSGTGAAHARELAVSGNGPAHSGTVGVSGSGTATGLVSLSGTGTASTRNGVNWVAVSGAGTATSEPCNGDPFHDLFAGYAISVTNDASGCTELSVLQTVEGLLP